jgi:hypothetical protein
MTDEEKKIIIDEDWKAQAQKEKELLKEKEQLEHQQEPTGRPALPEADFIGLVNMLAMQASFALGLIRNEEDKDKEIEPDWQLAKFNIDLLGILEEKCKGNLSGDEEKLLKGSLDQLRMLFVELSGRK